LNETARLEEIQTVSGVLDDGNHVLVVLFQLLADVIVVLDGGLVGDDHAISLLLQADELALQLRNAGRVLELEEAPLEHELG